MFDRILVPLDRSKLAEQVFPAVAELAGAFGSEIHLVGVCPPGEREEHLVCQDYMDHKAVELRARLSGSTAAIRAGIIVGTSAEGILSYADTERFDLVVMSSHGRSGINRWSLGTTVDKVLRHVHIPLLIVRTKEPPDQDRLFSRIAVPLDGSERSSAVLPSIGQLASRLPGEVFLIEVIEPGMHVRTFGGLDWVPFRERNANAAAASAKTYLQGVVTGFAQTKARVSCEVRKGEAAREIHVFADEKRCTLIAMCSYRESRMEAWVMGRVATRVLEASTQSVWLVPSFANG